MGSVADEIAWVQGADLNKALTFTLINTACSTYSSTKRKTFRAALQLLRSFLRPLLLCPFFFVLAVPNLHVCALRLVDAALIMCAGKPTKKSESVIPASSLCSTPWIIVTPPTDRINPLLVDGILDVTVETVAGLQVWPTSKKEAQGEQERGKHHMQPLCSALHCPRLHARTHQHTHAHAHTHTHTHTHTHRHLPHASYLRTKQA